MKWPWKKPVPRRADPVAIALLEHELFGIEPEPNTAAALVLQIRCAFGPGQSARAYVTPEFGDGHTRAPRFRRGNQRH